MIVNIPFDLGYGLTEYVEFLGYSLCQRGKEWHLDGPDTVGEAQAIIDSYNPWPIEKAKKIDEINNAFMHAVSELVSGTTEFERNSWVIQESEAITYSQDSNSSCPSLTVLANSRGIPLESLVVKVLAKSNLYKQNYFMLQGKRDKIEDFIKTFPDNGSIERLIDLQSIEFGN